MLLSISHLAHTVFEKLFGKHFSKQGFITYMLNIQWVTIARFFTMIFSLVTTMVIARILGPDTFGVLNYVLSINGLFAVVASLGVGNVVYKELVADKEHREEILGSSIALTMITGLITIAIVWVSLFFIHESMYVKMLILVMSLSFLTQPLSFFHIDFLKDKEAKYVAITQVTTLFISNVAKIIVVFFFASLLGFVIALVLENVLAGAIYLYQMREIKKRSIAFTVSKRRMLLTLGAAIPLAFMAGFNEIYARIDQIMLKHYMDTKAVGLYAAAVRLTEIWYVVPNILIAALFPALANASIEDQQEYRKRRGMFALLLAGVALLISIVTFFLSKLLITFIYGQGFVDAWPLLAVYIFSLIGTFISMLLFQDLFLKNRVWTIVALSAGTSILNVLLNIILIPMKGALGAAFATVISYDVIPIVYYISRTGLFTKRK